MKRPAPPITDRQLDEHLAAARRRVWPGPDHSPRVEAHLKGIAVSKPDRPALSRTAILLLALGAVGGGSLAAAVTHAIMSRRAVLVTDDGTRYDVQLLESPDGATGTFVTRDGTVFDLELAERDGREQINVEVTAPAGGTSTVILDEGTTPRVTTLPGQTARIEIQKPAEPATEE